MPKSEVPDKIFCGRKCKFVIDKEGKTFYCGESEEYELPNNATAAQFKEFKLTTEESNTEKIIDISTGIWYNLYVTDKGNLWATGRKFLKRCGIDSEVCVTLPITSKEGPLFVMKAWASQVKEEQMALVQCKTASGEIQLWSIGKNESGTLGLGGKVKETKVFTKLDYDSSALTFNEVSLFDDHAMAIDQNGLLWAWGNNQQRRAGLGDDLDSCFKPTKVTAFEDMKLKAIKISCGRNHSLVLAEEADGNQRLYSIGKDESNFKNLGCTQQQAGESVIRKIPHFADLEIADFSACSLFSMIILKGEKLATDGLYEHKLP
jgi:alpha-tubulin suppressor-like RCC1 family protein